MGTRRKSREMALQILFQSEYDSFFEVQEELETFKNTKEIDQDGWPYTVSLVEGIFKNLASIDSKIKQNSQHWKIERMDLVDRSILRLAVFELLFNSETIPQKVAINEAIEISKKYGTPDSKSFINGILDPIAKNQT